tara:strand:- start:1616 stop:2788 length:1173 start_codon:yes stop_codon:yes gene_type:complete
MSLKTKLIIDIPLTTGGVSSIDNGVVTLPLADIGGLYDEFCTEYRITGTQTLGSNFSISMTGAPVVNSSIIFDWQAVCTPAGFVVSILGKVIPTEYVGKNFIIKLSYYGVAWVVDFFSPSLFVASSLNADRLQDITIATSKLIDLSVTTAKIDDLGVTTGKLANLGVTTAKIANGAVTATQLGALAVTTAKINTKAVTTTELDDLAVTTAKIAAGAVTATELGALAVTTAKINTGAVTTAELGALAVTTAKIAAGAVTTTELGAAAVTPTKMSANANTYTRDMVLSFQLAAEVGVLNYTINETCSIVGITTTVLAPAVTDDITLIFKNNGGTELTASQTDITTGHVLGNKVSVTPSANNTFTAGDTFTIEGSKTTKTSGKVNVAIRILKA